MSTQIIPASAYPQETLRSFLNSAPLSFSNLDWLSAQERLEGQFCYALSDESQIIALMSCEPENKDAAWLRFFVSESDGNHAQYFRSLLDQALSELQKAGITALYTLSFKSWQEQLFTNSAFLPFTRIITLILPTTNNIRIEPLRGVEMRVMTAEDLPELETVDHAAFSSPWQLNARALQAAFAACSYNTVALMDHRIVAYQMTAANFYTSHLARLAVHPSAQKKGLGFRLTLDAIQETAARGGTEMTVNTQTNNAESLRLYYQLGFSQHGKLIPVFQRAVQDFQ